MQLDLFILVESRISPNRSRGILISVTKLVSIANFTSVVKENLTGKFLASTINLSSDVAGQIF